MPILARAHRYRNNIVCAWLDGTEIIVIARATFLWPQYKMKEMLMRETQPIGIRSGRRVRFEPDQIIPEYPPTRLHRDSEACGDHEQLLLLSVIAHRRAPTRARVVAKPLPSVFADAGPASKVRVAYIDPHAGAGLEKRSSLVKNFNQVCDIPLWEWFQAQYPAGLPIPVVSWRALRNAPGTLPILQNRPVVLSAIAAMTPIRRTRNEQVNAGFFECIQ